MHQSRMFSSQFSYTLVWRSGTMRMTVVSPLGLVQPSRTALSASPDIERCLPFFS